MIYAKGTEVYYRDFHGYVNYSDHGYLTITIRQGKHKLHDVDLVVKGDEIKEIRLAKESEK